MTSPMRVLGVLFATTVGLLGATPVVSASAASHGPRTSDPSDERCVERGATGRQKVRICARLDYRDLRDGQYQAFAAYGAMVKSRANGARMTIKLVEKHARDVDGVWRDVATTNPRYPATSTGTFISNNTPYAFRPYPTEGYCKPQRSSVEYRVAFSDGQGTVNGVLRSLGSNLYCRR